MKKAKGIRTDCITPRIELSSRHAQGKAIFNCIDTILRENTVLDEAPWQGKSGITAVIVYIIEYNLPSNSHFMRHAEEEMHGHRISVC